MGLRLEIDSDIANAFLTDLADAVKPFVGVRRMLSDSDWLDNGNDGTQIDYQGQGVFSNFSQYEIDNETILQTDTKLICLQSQVSDTPMRDDVINGLSVVAVNKDPADVAYFIQLRGN